MDKRKVCLIAGLVVAEFVLGEVLFLVGAGGLAANWVPLILVPFLAGMYSRHLLGDGAGKFLPYAAAFASGSKILCMFLQVKDLKALAVVLGSVVYYFVSYLFLLLGKNSSGKKRTAGSHEGAN